MSVVILPGNSRGNCAWSSHSATDWSTDETERGQNSPQKWVYPQDKRKDISLFCFVLLFCLFGSEQKETVLRCSQMMSRNSIRLIKGQNWIELIYRVNSESLMMKKKVWTSLLLKHKLLVTRRGALFTFQWESVTKMTRWRGSYCNAPVVSMINIFLSAPVTILPFHH